MDNLLESLYCNVLRETQFSIGGYTDIDTEVYDFFTRLSGDAFFQRGNIPFYFLIGGVLEVKDKDTWELEPFKTVFYTTFKEADRKEVLSFYYFIHYYSEHADGTSKLLSKLFGADIDFRVSIDPLNKIAYCKFDEKSRVFEVSIPTNIFQNTWTEIDNIQLLQKYFRKQFYSFISDNNENLIVTFDKQKLDNATINLDILDVDGASNLINAYKNLYCDIFNPDTIVNTRCSSYIVRFL